MYRPVSFPMCQYALCSAPNPPGRRVYCSADCAELARLDRAVADRADAAARANRHGTCKHCGASIPAQRRGVLPSLCRGGCRGAGATGDAAPPCDKSEG
jgi:predicted nucleic acid-binding Zn ribbon protein